MNTRNHKVDGMAAATQNPDIMGRPKSEQPKDAAISLRTHQAVRDAIEEFAREERRTLAQMSELMLREALEERLKKRKRDVKWIWDLP